MDEELPDSAVEFARDIMLHLEEFGLTPERVAKVRTIDTGGYAFNCYGDEVTWVSVVTLERWLAHGFDRIASNGTYPSRGLHTTASWLAEAHSDDEIMTICAVAYLNERTKDLYYGWRGDAFRLMNGLQALLNGVHFRYHSRHKRTLPVTASGQTTPPPSDYYELAHLIAVDIALCTGCYSLVRTSGPCMAR